MLLTVATFDQREHTCGQQSRGDMSVTVETGSKEVAKDVSSEEEGQIVDDDEEEEEEKQEVER